ncbi:Vacuolar fusion protein mon1 [Tulasnella sp. 425]|nr:Vacuolar fusion protein mon1 [Tulasnella sp. 425]
MVESAVASPEIERPARLALVEQKTKPLLVATPKQSGLQEGRTAEAPEEVASPTKEECGDEGKDRTSPVDISADTAVSTSQHDSLNTDETGSKETSKEGQEESETKSSAPPPPATPFPKVSLAVVTANRVGFEKSSSFLYAHRQLPPHARLHRRKNILCTSLGIPGLRHFIYKSRSHVQLVVPGWEDPCADLDEKRRLITLYQIVHDAFHARSGQPGGPLKLYSVKPEEECILGWITTPFELYVTTCPKLPKSALVSAETAVSRWVKKHEGELVLRDTLVF